MVFVLVLNGIERVVLAAEDGVAGRHHAHGNDVGRLRGGGVGEEGVCQLHIHAAHDLALGNRDRRAGERVVVGGHRLHVATIGKLQSCTQRLIDRDLDGACLLVRVHTAHRGIDLTAVLVVEVCGVYVIAEGDGAHRSLTSEIHRLIFEIGELDLAVGARQHRER